MLPSNVRHNNQGFTLIETTIIVVIVGILSAIAAPSFLSMFNKNKVNNALAQVQGTLQEARREAIRKSKSCTVNINTTTKNLTGTPSDCLVTGARTLDSSINLESNQTSIQFSYQGTITLSDAGTVVLSTQDSSSNKKCLVISSPLGIIRTGNYTSTGTNATNCNTSR